LLLLPLLGGATVWVVRNGLLPLKRVAREVQRRDIHSLTPIAETELPLEVAPLIQELNRLLQRLHAAFQGQRAFIADAAHELRSPLTAVRLDLQLLDRAPDESARREARLNLGAAVERAVRLVEQLLTLARSEPREAGGELAPTLLEPATAEGIADSHALALARHIDLGLEADPDVMVLGDRDALRTLVRNLIDNAVRYAPAGGTVQARIRNTPQGALLEVVDTGPGIPAGDRERIFDRFYRRAGAPEGGSGLGLAIVKAIADRHGARITLDDAPAGGLRVSVQFPPAS
jgi:signal transduction histidine kinase